MAIAAVLAVGCADFSRGGAAPHADAGDGPADSSAPEGGGPSSDAALSFAADVHGILTGTCERCHAAGQEAGDTMLILTGDASADYAVVMPFINTSAPASSRLLAKMSGNGHGGGTLYAVGTPQYQTVLLWIQEGAPP